MEEDRIANRNEKSIHNKTEMRHQALNIYNYALTNIINSCIGQDFSSLND